MHGRDLLFKETFSYGISNNQVSASEKNIWRNTYDFSLPLQISPAVVKHQWRGSRRLRLKAKATVFSILIGNEKRKAVIIWLLMK